MIKFLPAGIAATMILGIALNVLGTRNEVMASVSQVTGKGDRLDDRSESLCGRWPFYHHACQHDLKNSGERARKVRVLSQKGQRHRTFLTFLSK
jgi:hypothetical protein